jgi:hypothetical protein
MQYQDDMGRVSKARTIRQVKEVATYMAQCIIDHNRNIDNARHAFTRTSKVLYLECAAMWRQSYTDATNELAHIIDDMG